MGSLVIRCGAAAVALAVLWLFTAHWLSLLIDQVSTAPVASAPASPFGWDGVTLRFGQPFIEPKGGGGLGTSAYMLDLEGPGPRYPEVATASVDADNRLVLSVNGRGLVLGSRAGDAPAGGTPPTTTPAYAAEPGDVGVLTIERSWLSWPVIGLTLMTGPSPTWRRDIYYRLAWTKPSGQRLDMLWRFEQGFYPGSGWGSPSGTEDHLTGLIQAKIGPEASPGR
jgi:hypothetical protein